MQAIYIQQDCIKELYNTIMKPKSISEDKLPGWMKLRDMRNMLAGHPINKGGKKNIQRTFMSRHFGNYSCIECETWGSPDKQPSSQKFDLENLIQEYEKEAVNYLGEILERMKENWPKKKQVS